MIPFCLMAPRHATFHNLLRPYTVCCGVHCLRTGRESGNICPFTEYVCPYVEVLKLVIILNFGIYLLFRIRYIRSVETLLMILNFDSFDLLREID